MSTAAVSVVIPCYSCATVLARAVSSVFDQTLRPAELILVEDCSPDGGATRDAIARLVAEYHGKDGFAVRPVFLDNNVGPGGARNAGWDAASERYIAFLDADDSWRREKVEIQYAWMEDHPECDLSSHGSVYRSPGEGDQISLPRRVDARRIGLTSMLFKNGVLTRTVMLRSRLTQRFVAGARYSEDYRLWLQLLIDGCNLTVLGADLAVAYRLPFSAGGQSGNLWAMERAELDLFSGMVVEGKLAWPKAALAMGVSLVKYGRRRVIRWLKE